MTAAPSSATNRERRAVVTIAVLTATAALLGTAVRRGGSIEVCTQCGAMRHCETVSVASIPVKSSETPIQTSLHESVTRWNLVPPHQHDWATAIWSPAESLVSFLFMNGGSGIGNGREVQKTAQTAEMGILINALSEVGALELRAELLRTAFDGDRSGVARFTAGLIPEELRGDPAGCAEWVSRNAEMLKDSLQLR